MKNFLLSFFILFSSFVMSQCTHTIRLTDTYGDGWNGGTVSVSVNGAVVLNNITLATGAGPANFNFTAATGATIRVYRTAAGSWPSEMRIQVVNNVGTSLLGVIQPVSGTATTLGSTCVANCAVATPGCTNSSSYGSAVAPTTPTTVTISTCNYQTEYSTITGIVSGQTYQFGYSLGGYITVHTGTFNGPIVAYGNAPLNWASTFTGTVYVHYNTNSSCGTATTCGTSTITCVTCSAPLAPANDLVCNATNIICGQTIAGTTVNATNSGTGENSTCTISQTQPGVWYRVVGNGQIMTANLCATAWDSKISVFSGSSCSALTCVGGNDDSGPSCAGTSASFSWTSVVGTNYYILVHGFSTTSAFSIGLICTNPPPANPSSITATQNTICNGSSTTLTANGPVGTVYWYTGGCGITQIATGNTLTVSPTTATTYYARNFNSGLFSAGCASITITVNPVPQVTVTPTPNIICAGSSSQLISNVTGLSTPGNLVVTISSSGFLDETSWTLVNNLGTTIGSGGAYGSGTTNVIPIGNSANGPYNFSIETQGTFNDNTATYSITCDGTVILSGSLLGGQAFNQSISSCVTTPPITYSWTPTTNLTNPNAGSPFSSPTTTQSYTLTATSNGCSASTTSTVTVNPSVGFVSSITGNNTIIAGTQETYSISPVAGATYQWAYTESITSPLWINIPSSNSPSVSFLWPQTTTDGSVRITVSNSFNCGTEVRSLNIIVNGALPIELISFNGVCSENIVTINWITATEHNTSYFEIVKSRDGENWSVLNTIPAAGNSTQEISYTTKDENTIDGNNYYKLNQYDIDGKNESFGPISVNCTENSKGYFSVFPNPNLGTFQVILNNSNFIGDCYLIVKDTKGSEIINKEVTIKPGINSIYVEDVKKSSGIYYVYINNGKESTQILKMVIK
jgi:hypothetical protein